MSQRKPVRLLVEELMGRLTPAVMAGAMPAETQELTIVAEPPADQTDLTFSTEVLCEGDGTFVEETFVGWEDGETLPEEFAWYCYLTGEPGDGDVLTDEAFKPELMDDAIYYTMGGEEWDISMLQRGEGLPELESEWQGEPQHYLYDFLATDAQVTPSTPLDLSAAPITLQLLDPVNVDDMTEWPVPYCPGPVPFCPGPELPGTEASTVSPKSPMAQEEVWFPSQDITHVLFTETSNQLALPPVKMLSTMQPALQFTSNLGLPMMV